MLRLWCLLTAGLLVGAAAPALAQQVISLDTKFPPPPGYMLAQEDQERARTDIYVDRTDIVTGIGGQIYRASYDFIAPGAPSPLAILRHYRDLLVGQGGIRLLGFATETDGQLTGRVPGARPLWLDVSMTGTSGASFDVTVVEEQRPTRSEFAVAPEKISGRWLMPLQFLPNVGDAERRDVGAFGDRVLTLLQRAPALTPLVGFEASVRAEASRDEPAPSAAPFPFLIRLMLRPIHQSCPECRPGPGENIQSVEIVANDVAAVLQELVETGETGTPLYAAPDLNRRAPQVAETSSRRIVVTRKGRPPLWLPVPREKHIAAKIRSIRASSSAVAADVEMRRKDAEASLRRLDSVDPAAARAVRAEMIEAQKMLVDLLKDPTGQIESLQEELRIMSAGERGQPAIAEAGQAVVTVNPAYFDSTLPRGAAQFFVVVFHSPHELHAEDVLDRLRRDLDASAIAGLLTP